MYLQKSAFSKQQYKTSPEAILTIQTSGRFFFHVMASLAQMERELMVERTQAGLTAVRQRGGECWGGSA